MSSTSADTRERTILIVEDDRDIATAVSEVLRDEGFDVEIANNGQEGLVALGRREFGMILLDWTMPVLNGEGFLKVVRAPGAVRHPPIVILSADRSIAQRIATLDVEGFLTKPVDLQQLLSVAHRHAG